jgi:hypothetical protein
MTNGFQIIDLADLRVLDGVALTRNGKTRDVVYGFAATFAFEGGSTVQRRLDSLTMTEAFVRPFGDRFNHYHPPGGRSLRAGTVDDALARYRTQAEVARAEDTDGAVLTYLAKSADSASASQYLCRTFWASKWDQWSTVVAAQPVGTVLDRGYEEYVNDVLAWCDVLRPAHGTAGLAMIPNFGLGTRSAAMLAWPGLVRHPGLDWPDMSMWAAMVGRQEERHLRTVNWLTILDDAFVVRLGGRVALAEAVSGAGVTVRDWQGGVLLQAGAAPALGDTNDGDVPGAYRAVSAATRVLRFVDFKPRYGFLEAPPPILSGEASVQWVERFD